VTLAPRDVFALSGSRSRLCPLDRLGALDEGPEAEELEMETVLLKVHDVMNRLSVGQTKVYELMSSGELRSVKVGRARRVPSDELERFMAELDDTRPNLRLPAPARSTVRAS
jgi:excisionase family DNA binding protein